MAKINVGIIGIGTMGQLHLKNASFLANVVACADPSAKVQKKLKSHNISIYSDYLDLLKRKDLDAVIISLPTHLHKDCVIRCAERNVDMFVEKPLGLSLEECKVMIQAVKKHGCKLMVNHNFRYHPIVENLKSQYDIGAIGEVDTGTFELVINGPFTAGSNPAPIPEWHLDRDKIGGGCMFDSGYHLVDLFCWIFDNPTPSVLYVEMTKRLDLPYEDSCLTILKTKNTKGFLNVGWYCMNPGMKEDFRVILHGTAGYLTTDDYNPEIYFNALKEGFKNILRRFAGRRIHPLAYYPFMSSYFKTLSIFLKCVEKEETPPISGKEALNVVSILEVIYNEQGNNK